MRRGDAFPSRYLSKAEVDTPLRVVIKDVSLDHMPGTPDDEFKPVIEFEDGTPALVCNQTNWGIVEDAYGAETADWAGRAIEIYLDPDVRFGKKTVGGLRVRVPDGAGKPAAARKAEKAAPAGKGKSAEDIAAASARVRAMKSFNEAYVEANPEATKDQVRTAWEKMLSDQLRERGITSEVVLNGDDWADIEAGIAVWLDVPF